MKSIHRLQLAQNAEARVVKRTPKREQYDTRYARSTLASND